LFTGADNSFSKVVEQQNAQEIQNALLHIYEWLSTILTDLSTFSPEYSNFIIIDCVQVFAAVLGYSDYAVDDVENLSTDNVDKCLYARLLCGRCGKLIHNNCGKAIVRSVALWIVWKTYPQRLWKNDCQIGCFVDGVENLSTKTVESSMMKNWSYYECGRCGKLIHNDVDKLRGIDLALRTLLYSTLCPFL